MNKLKSKKYSKRASLTVEAALILPVFILACYTFLFFFYVIEIQENLHIASTKACENVAGYGYLVRYITSYEKSDEEEEINGEDNIGSTKDVDLVAEIGDNELVSLLYCLTDATLIKYYVKKQVTMTKSMDTCIVGGYDGILFSGSNLMDEEEFVTITMFYRIKCPVFKDILPSFPVVQTVRMHSFNGYKVNKKNEQKNSETVYVADNGSVYHTHHDCSYIKIDAEPEEYKSISSLRNESGGKYYACEACAKSKVNGLEAAGGTIYISKSGTRFHVSKSCSKIKRSATQVKLQNVGDIRKCSKCTKRDGG